MKRCNEIDQKSSKNTHEIIVKLLEESTGQKVYPDNTIFVLTAVSMDQKTSRMGSYTISNIELDDVVRFLKDRIREMEAPNYTGIEPGHA